MISENDWKHLKGKKLFLFDIDGTLALGSHLLEGAGELLGYLKETGKKVYFTTNNSTKSKKDYVEYFAQWGITVEEESLLTAGQMTVLYCKNHFMGKKIFLIGTPSLKRDLEKAGLEIVEEYQDGIDCVLAAFDTTLNYRKLEDASRILYTQKVKFIATNPDLCCPTTFGAIPDCGSICMMLENATGRKPHYIGKPAPDVVEECRRLSGCSKEETVLIGDRLYTDMLCAENAGVDGLLVLSGEAKEQEAAESHLWISYVMEGVNDLYRYLASSEGAEQTEEDEEAV